MKSFCPDKQTKVCLSFAASPGNFGNRFHNHLFRALHLNFIYLSRKIDDISDALRAVRTLGIHGCGVTMPFKVEAVRYVDELDEDAKKLGALNTVVNANGRLQGFNTDFWAINQILEETSVDSNCGVEILGAGGIALACAGAFAHRGFKKVVIRSRSKAAGTALADKFAFSWKPWPLSDGMKSGILVNATSLGFNEPESFTFPIADSVLNQYQAVWDVVASPRETELMRRAWKLGLVTVPGSELSKRQAVKQFQLYTGIHPVSEMIEQAFKFATQQ